ncbi:Manganese/iron superoxide dismutase, partial [Biscogniauxia marginata]
MLRPRLRIPRVGGLLRRPTPYIRRYHVVPPLDHIRPEEGVPRLLSPDGFDFAWTQYMRLMVQKLSAMVAGTEFEQQDPMTIIKSTAREPSQAAVFNYASMMHNNHLFFMGLNGATDGQEPDGWDDMNAPYEERIPVPLRRTLENNFSSIETLRREFLAVAMGMFGPGFVWLIKNSNTSEYRILATYLAGTPYMAGHWRRQPVDMNTQGGATVLDWLERAQTGSGAANGAIFQKGAPGGIDVIPLLCLNTWEHVWLRDYGVNASGIEGKRIFVESWWQCINWNRVEHLSALKTQNKFL